MSKDNKAKDKVENISEDKPFDRDYQMLNYFQEEFIYRHKHYWNIEIKSFLLSITITIIPIVREVFGLSFNNMISHFLLVFPVIGITLAIGSFILLLEEGKKMMSVNTAKYRLNKVMDKRYHYFPYDQFSNNKFRDKKSKSNRKKHSLSITIAILFLIIEVIVSMIVVIMLLNNSFVPTPEAICSQIYECQK